jgi:hypothetical protein
MSGITSLGTTYNLPNYTGTLFQLTPADTPFFSAIGGLTGGGQTTSPQFEWESFDLRVADQNVALEGATAPTAQERLRAQVTNVVQLHQEKVSVSYTKQAAIGQKAGIANDAVQPVTNEVDWQVTQMLKQMVRDIEWSFINGRYNLPSDNTTARKTRGLRQAIVTNRTNKGTVVVSTGLTATASTDKITATSHGLSNGAKLILRNPTAGGLSDGRVYYLVSAATNDFKVALTAGGSAVDITTDGTVDVYTASGSALAIADLNSLAQAVYDNGGLMEGDMATLIMNSTQKLALSTALAGAYGKYMEQSRTVGGVNFQTIVTDFFTFNVMLDRHVPQDTIILASLEQCTPVFEEIPGKGHFFAEPLAKTGASDDVQLYGEVGLAYGNEKAHGILEGLAF